MTASRTVESRFLDPTGETKIALQDQEIWEIRSNILQRSTIHGKWKLVWDIGSFEKPRVPEIGIILSFLFLTIPESYFLKEHVSEEQCWLEQTLYMLGMHPAMITDAYSRRSKLKRISSESLTKKKYLLGSLTVEHLEPLIASTW